MAEKNSSIERLLVQTSKAVVKLTEVQDSLKTSLNSVIRNNEKLNSLLLQQRIQHREQLLALKSTMENRVKRVENIVDDGMAHLQGQINVLNRRFVSNERNGNAGRRGYNATFTENNYRPLKRTADGKVLCTYCNKPLTEPYVYQHINNKVCQRQ